MKILIHKLDPHYGDANEDYWRNPDHNSRPDDYARQTFRTCSYCGCMHPEDFLTYLKQIPDENQKDSPVKVSGSDWKYNYPHKFYITIPNPTPENVYKVGSEYKDGVETPCFDNVYTLHGKFYSKHLQDCKDETFFDELCDLIENHLGIRFGFDETGFYYEAPEFGFQTWTGKNEEN